MAGRVAVVVFLLLLAGCGAFGGPERQTVTPAPVPDAGSTGLAPGVTAEGVDARRLGAAHRQATRNRSYTLEMRLSMEWGTQVVSLAVADSDSYEYRTEIVDKQYIRRVYVDGPKRYTYNERTQSTRIDTGEPVRVSAILNPDPARLVEAYLATDVRVERPDCGSCPVALTAQDPPSTFEPAENYSVRATVHPDGFVTSLRVGYWDPTSDSRVEYDVRYTAVGNTTVSRPAWVGGGPVNATDSGPALSDTTR